MKSERWAGEKPGRPDSAMSKAAEIFHDSKTGLYFMHRSGRRRERTFYVAGALTGPWTKMGMAPSGDYALRFYAADIGASIGMMAKPTDVEWSDEAEKEWGSVPREAAR